jgi:hypothetical protein
LAERFEQLSRIEIIGVLRLRFALDAQTSAQDDGGRVSGWRQDCVNKKQIPSPSTRVEGCGMTKQGQAAAE